MQVVLPDHKLEATYTIRSDRPMDDDEFYEFCMQNPDLRIEREANGEIVIMPPTGGETSFRNNRLGFHLTAWADRDGHGEVFESNVEFLLPDGTAYSPDASWIRKARLARLTREQKRRFIPLCPDFVVELTSPSDRLSKVQAKMQVWMRNGAQLGWLIDADVRTVYVYRPGTEPEKLVDLEYIDGEGLVAGFRLDLARIWQGL